MNSWDTLPMNPKQQAKMNELEARSVERQLRGLMGSSFFFGLLSLFLLNGIPGLLGMVAAVVALGAAAGVFLQTMVMDAGVRPLVSRQLILFYLGGAVFGGLFGLVRLGLMMLAFA